MSERKEIGRRRKRRLLQFERFKILEEFRQFANSVTGLPETHHPPFLSQHPSPLSSYPSVHCSQAIDTEKIKGKFLTNKLLLGASNFLIPHDWINKKGQKKLGSFFSLIAQPSALIACAWLQTILYQCKCGVIYSVIIDRSVILEAVEVLLKEN